MNDSMKSATSGFATLIGLILLALLFLNPYTLFVALAIITGSCG